MNETLLADAFEACLADMEQNGTSLEACLARYPALRRELEPALRAVLDVRSVPKWEVSREFRATARQRIIRRIRAAESRPSLRARLAGLNPLAWPGRLALAPAAVRVVAVILALALVVTGGTAIASSETLPDNPLYQIKLARESLELMLLPAGDGKTGLLVEMLDKRATELLTMSWQGKTDSARRALTYYEAVLQVAHKNLEQYQPEHSKDKTFAVQWQEALARNQAVLQGLADSVPPSARDTMHQAVAATEREQAWVNDLLGKTTKAPEDAAPTPLPERSPTPGQCTYTVKQGDTLSSLAKRHNTTWQRLAALNNLTSPDSIRTGQQLIVPCGPTDSGEGQLTPPAEFKLCYYTVKPGDTLSSIAKRYNTSTRLLMATNNLPSADRIIAGQKLSVPCYVR